MSSDLAPVLSFLSALSTNNDRSWFEEHRSEYQQAKQAVEEFVFRLFTRMGIDRGSHAASFWFHRIHRDLRFSRKKTPYKTHFSAVLDPLGKKRPGLAPYFHLQPGGESLVGGGLWAPEPTHLKRFRLDMEDGPRAFLAILESPQFRSQLRMIEGEKLQRVPKGFSEDHPAAELLKLKQVVTWRTFTDAEVLAPDFANQVLAVVGAMDPFLRYLEEASGMISPRDSQS